MIQVGPVCGCCGLSLRPGATCSSSVNLDLGQAARFNAAQLCKVFCARFSHSAFLCYIYQKSSFDRY